jgi:hypothetical protein
MLINTLSPEGRERAYAVAVLAYEQCLDEGMTDQQCADTFDEVFDKAIKAERYYERTCSL